MSLCFCMYSSFEICASVCLVCVTVCVPLLHPSVECGSIRALVIVADRAWCRGGGRGHGTFWAVCPCMQYGAP